MLANLFLHYALDAWLAREYPGLHFERYVDDAVVHCATRRQAEQVRTAIGHRLAEVGLQLHPSKTKIVYCQDGKRQGSFEHTSSTFLGYTFRPRQSRNTTTGRTFTSFAPAMSKDAITAKSAEVRSWRIHRRTGQTLADLAEAINPMVRGWMNYWGRYQPAGDVPASQAHQCLPVRWARKKYKRLRAFKTVHAWWQMITARCRMLFAHWAWTRNFWMTG